MRQQKMLYCVHLVVYVTDLKVVSSLKVTRFLAVYQRLISFDGSPTCSLVLAVCGEGADVAISVYANVWSEKKHDVAVLRTPLRNSIPACRPNEWQPCETSKRMHLAPSSLKERRQVLVHVLMANLFWTRAIGKERILFIKAQLNQLITY